MNQPFGTTRLTLRPLATGDLALYGALYGNPQTMRHIGTPVAQETAASNFAWLLDQSEGDAVRWWIWVLHDRHGGGDAGIAGLHVTGPIGEIGVMLQSPWRGRGVAAEAIGAICRRAFAAGWVDSVVTRHRATHLDAERLMKKLGFKRSEASGAVRWELQRPWSQDAAPCGDRPL